MNTKEKEKPAPLSSFNNYTLSLKDSLGRMLTQAEVKMAMYFYIRATDVATTLNEINKENK